MSTAKLKDEKNKCKTRRQKKTKKKKKKKKTNDNKKKKKKKTALQKRLGVTKHSDEKRRCLEPQRSHPMIGSHLPEEKKRREEKRREE